MKRSILGPRGIPNSWGCCETQGWFFYGCLFEMATQAYINYLQAYDTRLRARASPQSISEEAQRRMKERKEWAEKQRQISEKRMAEIKAQYEREKQAKEAARIKRANEAALVAEMLREMYRLNPEFTARREAVLQA